MQKPTICALDFESVIIPEVWIAVAEKTGIPELRLTTRDVADYDELMEKRLAILREHDLALADIQAIIAEMEPLPGAKAFLDDLRRQRQVVILSDTFYEFAQPFLEKLVYPTLFCHSLSTDEHGMIAGYHLREGDKKDAVRAFKNLGFEVFAAGDSNNDVAMLTEADAGAFFNAPEVISGAHPQFPAFSSYEDMQAFMLGEAKAE